MTEKMSSTVARIEVRMKWQPIFVTLAISLASAERACAQICGRPDSRAAIVHETFDPALDLTYLESASITFPRSAASPSQYHLMLSASHSGRVSHDSAHIEFEFWMSSDVDRSTVAYPIVSIPSVVPVKVELDSTTRFSWIAVPRPSWLVEDRRINASYSIGESVYLQAPPSQLARLVMAPAAVMEIRGRSFQVDSTLLTRWREMLRWAWCPAERQPR
jgi:hypothetical protein